MYVQLSRLRSSKGLHLLQKLDMRDLQFKPDPRLLAEIQRLQELDKKKQWQHWEGAMRNKSHCSSQRDEQLD